MPRPSLDEIFASPVSQPVNLVMPKTQDERNAAIADVYSEKRPSLDEIFGTQPAVHVSQYTPDPIRAGYQATMNTVAKPINSTISGVIDSVENSSNPLISAIRKGANLIGNSDAVSSAKNYVSDSAVGDVARQYSNELNDLKSYDANGNLAHDLPALAENIKLAGNAPILKGSANLAAVPIEAIGGRLEGAAANQVANRKTDFVKKLIMPKETPSVLEDQVGRTSLNGLGTKVTELSPQEQEVADAVNAIPRVSSKNTLQGNYNVIRQEIGKEATNLKSELDKVGGIFPKKELNARFNAVYQQIDSLPSILSGNKQAWAQQLIKDANAAIAKNPGTVSGILQARKDLDAVIEKYRPKAFDAATENALSEITPLIRNTMNDFIAEKAPSVGVKNALKTQSLYYRALDNIRPKAAVEAKTKVGRFAQKLYEKTPVKGDIAKTLALTAGTLGAGSITALAPTVALGGAALYGAGKVAASPILKKTVGKTLSTVGKALK